MEKENYTYKGSLRTIEQKTDENGDVISYKDESSAIYKTQTKDLYSDVSEKTNKINMDQYIPLIEKAKEWFELFDKLSDEKKMKMLPSELTTYVFADHLIKFYNIITENNLK